MVCDGKAPKIYESLGAGQYPRPGPEHLRDLDKWDKDTESIVDRLKK